MDLERKLQLLGKDPEEVGIDTEDHSAIEYGQGSNSEGCHREMTSSHRIVGASAAAAAAATEMMAV